jgi:serine/threonine protein kinase
MSLAPGARLGPYEIVSALGAGGMGEVYRARDTKLGREVAIKVVGESFTHDPERVARFQGEAQLLAALNHPHIATIHGLEETAGRQFLVMELVEGDTLAERLKTGPIPVAEALRIARQVADALQAAHEKGIIHRDLKPANIALTAEGQVKVLDFGLAKALEAASAGDVSASPTLSLAATHAGVILGTAAYMAPEQARGKPVDKRSDIWAFGCVLYEMLTGTRAFDGEDIAVVLASVIKGEPDWAALPADVPRPIVALLRSCLEKDRRSRTADIGAATFVLNHAAQLVERVEVPLAALQSAAVPRRPLGRRATPMAAAVAITALLAGAGVWLLSRPAAPSVVRMMVTTSASSALAVQGADRDIAITPDGSRIVYRGNNQLLVRALDQLEPSVLRRTPAATRRRT